MKQRRASTAAEDARASIPGTRREAAPTIVYHELEQGSPEWFQARCGLITASNLSLIMSEKDDTIGRKKLLYRLAAERVTEEPATESYKNRHMERGKEMEPEAVAQYERDNFVQVRRVGFVTREIGTGLDKFRIGASPDGVVDPDGGVETKTEMPDLFAERLDRGLHLLPAEHRAQCQGNIFVLDRAWWDLKIFWPKMPRFVVRFHRDEKYIAEIANACERFEFDLVRLVERLKRMG